MVALSVAVLVLGAVQSRDSMAAPPPDGAIVLFDGKTVRGLHHGEGKPCAWKIVDGALEAVPRKGGSLFTKRAFRDFRLHVEFRIPDPPVKGGNSGVYLQRRYEIQIINSYGQDPKFNGCGSLYRQRAPDRNVCRKPGEWQVFDIRFRAARFDAAGAKSENARLTLVWNGVKVHDKVDVKNKTGAGRPEAPDPLPILFQDHGAPVRFRNLWVVPGKDSN